jgi:hypothetical protein
MPSDLHADLVALGAKWLRKQGFGVVATELAAVGCREQADVVGFRSTCSAIIEVKVSRSDFLADAKKPERAGMKPGIDLYRFYLCPPELILPGDLPPKWGLLHGSGRKVTEVVRPTGNIWPRQGYQLEGWSDFQHAQDHDAERSVLYSIARRLTAGKAVA